MPRLDEQITTKGKRGRPKEKRKRLILEANACVDRQWSDVPEAVYPLLREFGFFKPEQE